VPLDVIFEAPQHVEQPGSPTSRPAKIVIPKLKIPPPLSEQRKKGKSLAKSKRWFRARAVEAAGKREEAEA